MIRKTQEPVSYASCTAPLQAHSVTAGILPPNSANPLGSAAKPYCFVGRRGLCSSLYGLINNAALPSRPGSKYPLHDDQFEYWEKIMATNLTAPWFLTRTIFPHMATGGHVRVVFMSSEAAWASTPGFGMYNISKAALNSLGHSLAQELAAYTRNSDIQINTVVPGEARTEMNQGSNTSPYAVVSMLLLLLSHPDGGPNGRFFHRDGRHLQFGYSVPYSVPLM